MTESADLRELHALALHVAGIGLGSVDYDDDTITLDARAGALFDLDPDTPHSRALLHDRIHPDDRDKIDYQVERLLDPENEDFIDVQHRVLHRDGRIVWVSARKQVTFAERQGKALPATGLVAIMDITGQRAAQSRVEDLLQEMNHRQKNLLTVVQSLARRTLASGPADSFEERFSNRLNGLMHNMDTLSKEAWEHADLGALARSHLAAFAGRDPDRIRMAGPPARVPPEIAQAVGMAFHELATNAVKYGALSSASGRVDVEWGPEGEDRFVITWREIDGPPVTPPERRGFGHSVMTEMAEAAVSGEAMLDYGADGVVWRLSMPRDTLR